jgi:hypothetical protein
MSRARWLTLLFLLLPASPARIWAQTAAGPAAPRLAAGPPRSPDGRLLVVAEVMSGAIKVDGVLGEDAWRRATPVSGFVQSEPQDGQPATEATDVRVVCDKDTLYIGAVCHDREAGSGIVSQIREDFTSSDQDTFEVILDTFADRRNGFVFITNRAGARSDQQVANEGRETNASWDAAWVVGTHQSADGWTVEMAVPFRSLRFRDGDPGPWGINFSRRIRRKNEVDFWSPVSRAYNLARVSLAGNLTGLSGISAGRNLQVKPYLVSRAVRPAGVNARFDAGADLGVDLKYGLTPALTLDAAVNPDFAQVEADELTVNLTQFSTFYPEKRDFFIENSGLFYVGDAARNNRVTVTPTPDEDLLLFHSRRIGLRADGTPIDIFGGARLTGHAAGLEVGLLTMQTRATSSTPATNYTVLRARRNLRPGSEIGAILLTRQSAASGDFNRVGGVDANLRFGRTDWNSYLVRTAAPGARGGEYAVRTSLNREGNFFHGKVGYLRIGEGFADDLGYFRRTSVQKALIDTGIRLRPVALHAHGIRELHPHITWNYYTDLSGRTIGKKLHTGWTFFLNDGTFIELSVNPTSDQIAKPLPLSIRAPSVPAGYHAWTEYQLRYNSDASRPVSVVTTFTAGGLWTGTQRSMNVAVLLRPSYRLQLSIGVNRTAADLRVPDSRFVTAVWAMRTNYSFTTNMFLDSLVQYDADRRQFTANVRFNLIHHPLSDFFVVYNDQELRGLPGAVAGRSVILKITRMLAF